MLGGCFVAVGTAAKTRSAQSNLFRVLYMGKCPFVEQSLKTTGVTPKRSFVQKCLLKPQLLLP
jgi:hypothetical protein